MSVKYKRQIVTCLEGVSDQFILNTNDLSAILNIDQSKAGELLATAEIPGGFRAGRLWRIYAGDLRKHIDSQKLPLNPHVHEMRQRARRRRQA